MLYQQVLEELHRLDSKPLNKNEVREFRRLFRNFLKTSKKSKEISIEIATSLNSILAKQLTSNKIPGGFITGLILEVNKINEMINSYFF